MRILYSHRTHAADGQATHIEGLRDALVRAGHRLELVKPGEAARAGRRLGARLPAALYEAAEFGYSVPGYYRLKQMAAKAAPDVIYERYNLFYHAGAWLRRTKKLPLLLEINAPLAEERARHDRLFWKDAARASERAIWRSADAALCVSEALAQKVGDAGIDRQKIHVIHNGVGPAFLKSVDPAPIRARYRLEDRLVLGFSGFMRDWHGLIRVIDFIARARDPALHLFLVGDGPARESLETQSRALGIDDQVTITGAIALEEMPSHLAAFDIALQPAATAYASPLKLFEYMAMGRAILAPDQPNICEILTGQGDSLLFNPQSEDSFDAALRALCADAELRARLGAAAREALVRRDFTWDGNARRVVAIAKEIIEAGP